MDLRRSRQISCAKHLEHKTQARIRTILEVRLGGLDELEGSELEAALLEPGDDLADEVALNAVRLQAKSASIAAVHCDGRGSDLDHDVGALGDGHFVVVGGGGE